MPLLARTVNTPLLVEISEGALDRLGALLSGHGIGRPETVGAVVGAGLGDRLLPRLARQFGAAEAVRVDASTVDEGRRLEAELRGQQLDAVVAVGGGGTLDTAKWASTMLGLPCVAVATSLAHDGIASPVAVLESDGHRRSFGVHMPLGVVVDLDLVAEGPVDLTRSGIGDVVSNLSAVEDWYLARDVRGEAVDGLAAALATNGARAVLGHEADTEDAALLAALAEALVLSGISMSVAGSSRPASGGCHEISHAIDARFPGTAAHGQQVAVGALFASFLRESDLLPALDACFRRHGVCRTPSDLGLTEAQFLEALALAPSTRPGRYTVLEHLLLSEDDLHKRLDAFLATVDR